MKKYNVDEMQGGYFIGNFEPSVFKTDKVEIAEKKFYKGDFETGYYRKIDKEIVYIVKGKLENNGNVYTDGDILLFEPGEIISWFVLEDSKVIVMRFPGTKKDLYKAIFDSYEETHDFYSKYLESLREICKDKIESDDSYLNGNTIKNEDITVVIQGAVDKKTFYLIKSIREYLPGASIILSTWKGTDIEGIDVDTIILNDDPGSEFGDKNCLIRNNVNRQIVSTREGIKQVKTLYTLKLRSDLLLLDNSFIKYFDLISDREDKYCIFDKKIVVSELYSTKYFEYQIDGKKYSMPLLFHPSDWFLFGLTNDIKTIYDNAVLMNKNEFRYSNFRNSELSKKNNYQWVSRYACEQQIFIGVVKAKFPELRFDDLTDISDENEKMSGNIMKNNFTYLDMSRSGILNQKYVEVCFINNSYHRNKTGLYTFEDNLEKDKNEKI